MKSKQAMIKYAAALALGVMSAACGSIYDESDCVSSYNLVKFTYDYNLKYADAFGTEVDHVTLYTFSTETGQLVSVLECDSKDLGPEHEAVLDVAPGEYDLLVWAGDRNDHYAIAAAQEGLSAAEDFHCRLIRDENGESARDIDRLYHGMEHVSLGYASATAPNHVTVNLKKNTNSVRVVLQHLSGEPVISDDFEFTISDGNGWLNHDNSLRDNTTFTYRPWYTYTGTVDINTNPRDPQTGAAAAVSRSVLGASLAEFTVSRLLTENKPMLTVRNRKEGTVVLSVPLIDYALLVKGLGHSEMTDQEYLDRQDEYNMTFFLDEGGHWLSSVIIINDWRIIRHESDLEGV